VLRISVKRNDRCQFHRQLSASDIFCPRNQLRTRCVAWRRSRRFRPGKSFEFARQGLAFFPAAKGQTIAVKCTMQVCTLANGKTAVLASGKPFSPSTTAIRMSSTPRLRSFHEKAVKLFLKFMSHFSSGGGIVLPSGLGMLVHVLIRCLRQRVERCYLVLEVSC
jgi:hypothetical protein